MIIPRLSRVSMALTALGLLSSCGNTPTNSDSSPNSTIPWNTSVIFGSVTDNRDGKTYKTVQIGTQTWFAENLNYTGTGAASVGAWPYNSTDSGAKYGRLYTWSEAMAGQASNYSNPSGVQGLCPGGWHVPSDAEWAGLQAYVDGTNTVDGPKLKSTAGWNINTGVDTYGFRVLPAGHRNADGSLAAVGFYASFWSTSESDAGNAWLRLFGYGYGGVTGVIRGYDLKANGFSVRCLENSAIILPPLAAPTFGSVSGTYTAALNLTLSSSTAGATIFFTTDGSTPTPSSTQYTGQIKIATTETVRAIAESNGNFSSVSSAFFTINPISVSTIPWNTLISYGSLTDTRDGQVYKTVNIGAQTWMAQNLNYAGAGVCYNNSTDSCAIYGRLYTWAEVMAGHESSALTPSGVQGVCPTGWHVPSDAEWSALQTFVDPTNTTDGTKLKSTSGWLPYNGVAYIGMDTYGFRALAGGYPVGSNFSMIGVSGIWWSATEFTGADAWNRNMFSGNTIVYRNYDDLKPDGYSLRCLKN